MPCTTSFTHAHNRERIAPCPCPTTPPTPWKSPPRPFNADGIAVINISGGRYGGHWDIDAFTNVSDEPIGEIQTCYDLNRSNLAKDDRYPDLAVDTAYVWLHDHVKTHGWRLLTWDNLNAGYGPEERPYFMAARALIGNDSFVPAPGVKYADEIPF